MTQGEKILDRLMGARGEWINGRVFLHDMYLSQYHARIFDLQRKGYVIEASDFTDDYGFKSYRIPLPEPIQERLFETQTA